jgi:hypothetical protein
MQAREVYRQQIAVDFCTQLGAHERALDVLERLYSVRLARRSAAQHHLAVGGKLPRRH